jgi:fucose 4-O-acetylase-like acetyltransferase
LALSCAGFAVAVALDHFGRFDLARPTLTTAAVLGMAIWLTWKWRRQMWYWLMIVLITAIHVALILLVPWSSAGPGIIVVPVGFADLWVVLWALSAVQQRVGHRGDQPVKAPTHR